METEGLVGEDYDSSESEGLPEKTPSTQELERTPSERHAFLFRHNLGPTAPDLREFYPSSSQASFLLHAFAENINIMLQIVHMPTVSKMVHGNDLSRLKPANQALVFAIYYAAVTSMEDDDVSFP